MPPLSSPLGRALVGGLGLLVAIAAYWLCARPAAALQPPAPAAAPAVQVSTVRVQAQTVPIYRSGIGTVTAAQSVTVKARIDGQLDAVAFREGQDVKSGQLLARLDPRTLQAQLAQAVAQKARDAAQLGNARIDLRRYETLVTQDAATPQQLETQRALVAQLEAALQTDDAQISYAQVQLGFTKISAPIAGRVGARLVDVGNIVHAADAGGLLVINQIDPITVVFTLPEDAVPAIVRAEAASREPLLVNTYPRSGGALLASGALVLLNNQIDTSSGTVQLKARCANPTHVLWPGQYVNVRLLLGARAGALTVPAGVVQRSQDGSYVWVVKADDSVGNRPVQVTQIQDGLAVIEQGLAVGERVVVDGQYKLKPGVRVVEVEAASAPAAR